MDIKNLIESFNIIKSNKRAFLGFIMLSIFLITAVFGPLLIPLDMTPDYINRFKPPSLEHILGTDYAGRDILIQIIHGSSDIMLIAERIWCSFLYAHNFVNVKEWARVSVFRPERPFGSCPIKIINSIINDEVNRIMSKLNNEIVSMIAGFKDDKVIILDDEIIINIYANDSKVFAVTNDGEYILKFKLYELEDKLDSKRFVRISNSEIINLII